jgi:hypothetical protein
MCVLRTEQHLLDKTCDGQQKALCKFFYFKGENELSPFALSIYHFLHFKLSVESSTQSQPLQDICL